MESDSEVGLEYPQNQLKVLTDPTTYLALLCSDIQKYVLRFYLQSSDDQEPIEGTWRTPRLVSSYHFKSNVLIMDFCIMASGDLLVLTNQRHLYRINLTDPSTSVLLSDQLYQWSTINYETATDTLFLPYQRQETYGKGGRTYAFPVTAYLTIPLISTIWSKADFHAAFLDVPGSPEVTVDQKMGRHTIKYARDFSTITFCYNQTVVAALHLAKACIRSQYFGGYLLVLTDEGEKINVYSCFGE